MDVYDSEDRKIEAEDSGQDERTKTAEFRLTNIMQTSASGGGCVKTQKNLNPSKNRLSKRALCRFLGVRNGNPTHEYFEI